MTHTVQIEGDDDQHILAVDAAKTIAIWALEDTPLAYRQIITLPAATVLANVFVARVPAGYSRDIKHITRDPYFAPQVLDVYNLVDGSTLYVGA